MVYLTTSLTQIQEGCLVVMKQCVKHDTNLRQLLDHQILDFLYDCLCQQPLFHLRKSALLIVEVVSYIWHVFCCFLSI